ncbi:hypothetical protein DOH45_26415, partial [Salmonella enterica subsp. enterica serovar Enteritidis]|nr:hypothetical protein [Salmonella enterica subsp. enterica serovar Enteritidis]
VGLELAVDVFEAAVWGRPQVKPATLGVVIQMQALGSARLNNDMLLVRNKVRDDLEWVAILRYHTVIHRLHTMAKIEAPTVFRASVEASV